MNEDNSREWRLNTVLPVSYYVKNSANIFGLENPDILGFGTEGPGSRRLVVIDLKVSELYLKQIIEYLIKYKIDYHVVILDATETKKNIDTLLYLLKEIESFGLSRKNEPILAVGGGVLLDIVGLAANLYRRGVPYICVPTTLLGLVDASVGAKTSINFENRRNRLGSYYPPIAAYIDKSFLETLEPIEISSGIGEILKMAVVKDLALFEILKSHGRTLYESKFLDCEYADEVINRSVKGMIDELQENLWEKNLKRLVDFGHSFSPIPEMRSLVDDNVPTLTHGQAVTLDVIFSSVISFIRGKLSSQGVVDIIKVAREVGLPTHHPYFADSNILMEALNDTIKHRNGDQNLPIPIEIGTSLFVNDLTYDEIKEAAQSMQAFHDEVN
ncbi:MAG: sedoheptulose 7-phosphate cyclase [Desulfobulbaceae bacterium]|nr:sedoheptulose 7-phosphate cyclase [Desulfobulbaceae bacterium]